MILHEKEREKEREGERNELRGRLNTRERERVRDTETRRGRKEQTAIVRETVTKCWLH